MKRIIFLTYPGAEGLDIAGPAAVFSAANDLGGAGYQTITASHAGGPILHSGGLEFGSIPIGGLSFLASDTVLVPGGVENPVALACQDPALLLGIRRAASVSRRFGSVCTGAFILGAAGLLKGRHVATHWESVSQLTKLHPEARVNGQSLYTIDGELWTSAGVASGIDMALAMVEADFGQSLRCSVANRLVVHSYRVGHQSQFSEVLRAQNDAGDMFSALTDWLRHRIGRKVSVSDMADYENMTVRTFQRKFSAHMGQSPAKYLERLKLETARDLLAEAVSVSSVSRQVGFESESAFRKAFRQVFGVSPSRYALSNNRYS